MFCYRKTGNGWGRRESLGLAKSIVCMYSRNGSAKLASGSVVQGLPWISLIKRPTPLDW